ncbi:Putative membrane protein [Salmonella enterica subsp. enterica serovar Adelaide str. A4-669]|uniref:Membrane protein n=1 Tax=Salmonella enterica subsp. enterica serovar Adelaide str. A4-669 TaxID=913063 RepID=A0A6C8GIX9_SALET|nr:Putative membrane protein [Salmonella enterica subsp. enterica serovar Adelaide str. A4-669]
MVPGLGEVLWANGLLKLFLTVYQDHHKTNPYRIIYVICLVWVRFLLLSDNC